MQKYYPNAKGKAYLVIGNGVRMRQEPNVYSAVLATLNTGTALIHTGYEELTSETYDWKKFQYGSLSGWIREDLVKEGSLSQSQPAPAKTQTPYPSQTGDTEKLFQNINYYDRLTMHKLLLGRELIDRGEKAGVIIPDNLTAMYQRIAGSYNQRQQKLRDDKSLKTAESPFDSSWKWLKSKWIDLIGVPAVGFPFVPVIIAVAVVGITCLIVWNNWKGDEKKALEDYNEATGFIESIQQYLPPEILDNVKNEYKDTLDNAYKDGQNNSSFLDDAKGLVIPSLALITVIVLAKNYKKSKS